MAEKKRSVDEELTSAYDQIDSTYIIQHNDLHLDAISKKSEFVEPTFVIQPPQTGDDLGKPSDSVLKDAHRIFSFIEDERHMCARNMYLNVKQRLNEKKEEEERNKDEEKGQKHQHKRKSRRKEANKDEYISTRNLLTEKKEELIKLEERAELFESVKRSFDNTGDWILAQTFFGIRTYYRRELDGSLSILIEGKIKEVPLFEQIAVLREVDLNHKWAPFCDSSFILAQLDKLDVVGRIIVGLPTFGISRDICFRAIGCDSILEEGCVILAGTGVGDLPEGVEKSESEESFLRDDPILQTVDIPPVPKRLGSGRMTLRKFHCIVEIESPTSANTKIIFNVNPNMSFVPLPLIEFCMKKMCGHFLYRIQGAAKKIVKNPLTNIHAKRMRDTAAFYRGWLMPKFEAACGHLGWKMSPVGAFQLPPSQLEEEFRKRRITPLTTLRGTDDQMNLGSSLRDFDQILSSLSAKSEPVWLQHGRENQGMDCDLSEISELSGNTWSVWRSNPVVSYMKGIKKGISRRKIAEHEEREKATERLKPRDFELHQLERLKELKQAKQRAEKLQRSTQSGVNIATSATVYEDPYRTVRICVVVPLFILLFLMLHVDLMVTNLNFFYTVENEKWWMELLKAIGMVWYISSCGTVHFALCDVTLILGFHSLEFGKKAGQQTRSYYSSKIRMLVALLSGSLVILGITKAIFTLWLRSIIWSIVILLRSPWVQQLLDIFEQIHRVKEQTLESIGVGAHFVPHQIKNLFNKVTLVTTELTRYLLERVIFPSIYFGNSATNLFADDFSIFSSLFDKWNNLLSYAWNLMVLSTEGNSEIVSWRYDAFLTSKYLFSRTAVFLVVLILLFQVIIAKTSKKNSPNAGKNNGVVLGSSNLTNTSCDQSDYANEILSRTTGRNNSSMQEQSERSIFSQIGSSLGESKQSRRRTSIQEHSERSNLSQIGSSLGESKKSRRRRFFRRREKPGSSRTQ